MSWGMGNVGGGAAAGLNFSIVGGTTRPIGKENLIWINTNTAITSWVFSANEPTYPDNGMVWISTITSSSVKFNALKKNGIWIYPSIASQYIGGTWIKKDANIYQNGSWNSFFDGRVFDNGLVNGITFSKTSTDGTLTVDSTISLNSNGSWNEAYVFSDQTIDVSSYRIMRVTYKFGGYVLGDSAIGLATTRGTTFSNFKRNYPGTSELNTEVTRDIDIAGATGEYYIGGCVWSSGNGSASLTLRSILLIP